MGIQITRYDDNEMETMLVNHSACIFTISCVQAFYATCEREYDFKQ